MSLRLRLTLLYSTFMGGILLIFGATVYILVNVILLNQVDTLLAGVAREIVRATTVDETGDLNVISLPQLDMTANAYVQVCDTDGRLVTTSPSIGTLNTPLDPAGLEQGRTMYEDSYLDQAHLRVLTVPLKLRNRIIGTLQVAASLTVVDATRTNLLSIMAVIAVGAVGVVMWGSWAVLGRALAPLQDMQTQWTKLTAPMIFRAVFRCRVRCRMMWAIW